VGADLLPPWAQPGVTDVPAARAFLAALSDPGTLTLTSADADVGYPLTRLGHRFRGHGVSIARSHVAATPPHAELAAYHRSLGLAPQRVFCPAVVSHRAPLARLVLDDDALCARLRADRSLTRILLSFKDRAGAALVDRLGLEPAYCAPAPDVYETANDKLVFAEAGARYGFDTVPTRVVRGMDALDAAFEAGAARWGAGCALRLRRGAGGRDLHHAPTLGAARRIGRRLLARGDVLVTSWVPSSLVVRDVATHGIVSAAGFAPLAFSEQVLRGQEFRGGRVGRAWEAEEVAVLRTALARIARWLADLGYVDAPAGIDGLLVREDGRLRFRALDPNVRLTGTMLPWAAVARLSEAAGRPFVWQFEWLRMVGRAATFERLRRHLGPDLLAPDALDRGGVLPAFIRTTRIGPLGASALRVILLAHDEAHLAHLRARVCALGLMHR
jgi:hypothetical protein